MNNQLNFTNNNFEKFTNKIVLRDKIINYIIKDYTITSSLTQGIYWELWMLDYLKKYYKKNTNMIDCGAHIGTTSLLMSEILTNNNKIYSFEPIYNNILLKNIFDNNLSNIINVYPYGLGNNNYNISIPFIDLEKSNNFGGTSIIELNNNLDNNSDIIQIYNLDSFNFQDISVIKIDVENMELEVLEGSIELITKYKPTILLETFYYKKFIESDIFKKMIYLGYEIFPILEGWNDYIIKIK